MKKILLFLLIAVSFTSFGQISKTGGILYSNGDPNTKGLNTLTLKNLNRNSEVAVDQSSGSMYVFDRADSTYKVLVKASSMDDSLANYYRINPLSNMLYTGITNLDTNVVRYGVMNVNTGSYQSAQLLYDNVATSIMRGRRVYIDYLYPTVYYGDYKIGVQNTVTPTSTTIDINKVRDDGAGLFVCRTPNSASTPGSYVKARVGYYESDSTLEVGSGYNNNALVYLNSQQYNVQHDFTFENVNIFGWTCVFAPLANMTNCSFNGHIGKLKQYLPYSIVAGDNGKGTILTLWGGQTLTNTNITITVDEADLMDNGILINAALVNSRIVVKVKNCRRTSVTRFPVAAPLITIAGSTDATSQIVIEGDFYTSTFEVVDIQANMNVLLKGTFETASTTKGAIKLSATAANVKLQGLLKTGHTESITAAGAYSISILPGSAANKAVGASVTQVGGTLTVNAGF